MFHAKFYAKCLPQYKGNLSTTRLFGTWQITFLDQSSLMSKISGSVSQMV